MFRFSRFLLTLAIIGIALCQFATCTVADCDEIDFARDIRSILSDKCYNCHGPDEETREADLRLDTKDGLFQANGDTQIVTPNHPESSELIRRIVTTDEDERMPPVDSLLELSPQEIQLLTAWVKDGAAWKGHWSFQPIVRPDTPDGQNAIDYFVRQRLEREGMKHSPEASKERLLRRVTFDLIGLPPTLDELDTFLADDTADAYEGVVDRLLASKHYGERMAWDWLDAARYADTNGFQGDRERTMWPWRDWVVKAFNNNMPYDQFTVWQLAGDLLPDATTEQKLATAFNRNHMINGEGGRIAEENRIEYVFDQMETMGTVWMGLTLQCCRCHDHKFDPLARREYYQLFAFFNQTPVTGGGGDPQMAPNLVFGSPEQEAERQRLNRETDDARKLVEQAEATLIKEAQNVSEQDRKNISDILAKPIQQRDDKQFAALESFGDANKPEYSRLVRDFRAKRKQRDDHQRSLPRVMVMQDMVKPRETFMLKKGIYNQLDEKVSANTPAIFPSLASDAAKNRLALAKWLVDPSHPLTARVTVNRYWQLFFGSGLVKTTDDFGSQGERPSHPKLLDWLASDFVESGWDVKRLHKTIVMSATYRQTAKTPSATSKSVPGVEPREPPAPSTSGGSTSDTLVTPAAENEIYSRQVDPENRLLARGPRFRMSSWMLRDHALSTSGLLVAKQGGPSVKPYQPPGVWSEATFGKKTYQQGKGEDLYRRSLYSYWRRIVGPTMFFDEASRQTCSVLPGRTNTPLHALTTMNDVTYIEAARALAERVMISSDQDTVCIETAFRLATSRKPTVAEKDILLARLEELKAQYSASPEEAKQVLSVGESPRDEQLDAIEHAAYTGLCSLILNLDEALVK